MKTDKELKQIALDYIRANYDENAKRAFCDYEIGMITVDNKYGVSISDEGVVKSVVTELA
jgi:hypothetical protein